MKLQLLRLGLALLLTCFLPQCAEAQNDTIRTFTKEHPLVFEDSWDLWPYSFLDEQGAAQGFNIELMRLLLDRLDIPYIIKLKSRHEVLEDLREGRADLTFGMHADYHHPYGRFGSQVVQLFTHSVLVPKGKPITIKSLNDLAQNKVIVHQNSYSHNLMISRGWGRNAIPLDDMREAVQDLSTTMKGQILWNSASLKWLLRMYQIENLDLSPVDMPHGEYKFMAKDSLLLQRIDQAFSEARSDDLVEPLQTKWFYPERQDTGIPSWIWFLTGGIGLLAFILLCFNLVYHTQERQTMKLSRQRNNRLALVLQASKVRLWSYDIATQTFTRQAQAGQPEHRYAILDFARMIHANDFERLCEGLQKLASQEEEHVEVNIKVNHDILHNGDEREYVVYLSVLRYENDKPSIILGTVNDVTEERKKQHETELRLKRYQSVFNTAMVDMVYFDHDGYVANMNERAQHSFKAAFDDVVKRKVNIKQCLGISEFNLKDYFYATKLKDKKHGMDYYELQLVPVFDRHNKQLGIYGTGRDVTEVVTTYHKAQECIRKVQQATQEITNYVSNINYVLDVGGMRMVTYSPSSHILTVFKGLNQVQLSLTQSRCMTLVDEKSKKKGVRILNSMDNLTAHAIYAEIKTTLRRAGIPLYLQLRLIPIYDGQGKAVSYFGLCRDVSQLKATEALLEIETQRAQEEEDLKNSFLRNMNYEIRTPLNNVVGFAELLEQPHSPEDETIFIDQIKNSSAHLLDLINDILFLSRLDAHMIEINKQPIDFALTFEGHCQMGWANSKKPGVHYIVENRYEQLVVDIDDTNLGRIIEQIAANAAQHTDSGTVRARYDYMGNKLLVAIEDTGCGMSHDRLRRIYDRFNSSAHQGTGLGLPICRALAEQLGGSIDVSSEEGRGTTVWITIPCTATAMERKKEIWHEI